MFILYAKTATTAGLIAWLVLALWYRAPISRFLDQRPWPFLALFYGLFRLLPFVLIYGWLGFRPQSDVAGYYFPISLSAMQWEVPYRDVYNPYSPFYGYWLAQPLRLWVDTRMIVLTLTLIEWLAVWLTYRLYRTSDRRGDRLFRCLVYFLLPVPFAMSLFSGQEDVMLWLFLLPTLYFLSPAGHIDTGRQAFWIGALLAVGLLSTKAVFVFLLVPIWLATRPKLALTAGLVAVGLPVLVWLLWQTGTLFLEQPMDEGTYHKAPNWRSVLAPWLPEALQTANNGWKWGGMLAVLATTLWAARLSAGKPYRTYLPYVYVLIFSAMTVVQQNAVSNYAYLFMLPLTFILTDFRNRADGLRLLGFNALAAVHPTLWWRIGQPFYNGLNMFDRPIYAVEYAVEVLLVIGFAHYAFRAARGLQARPEPQPVPVRPRPTQHGATSEPAT